jgi:hypothetical protein
VKTAKRAAFGAFAATVMAMVTPLTSASADQGDTFTRGCGFDTSSNAATNGQDQGVIYVLGYSSEAPPAPGTVGAPSTATVSCWIDVNGAEQPGTRLTVTGNGVIAGQQQIQFTSLDSDTVTECQQVTFADGSTWTAKDGNVGVDCPAATVITDQPVIDLLNGILSQVDPTICPIIAMLAGTYGPVVIDNTGDIWINDPLGLIGKVYDCLPYDV